MTDLPPYSRLETVRGYLVLPHFVPILAVLFATSGFAIVAAGGWPGLATLVCLLGAMLGGQLAVGAVNELCDAELDAVARPEKPIPAGLVSRRGAFAVIIVGLTMMVAFSLRFSFGAFLLCALGNGVGVAYSIWFKRTMWSWVPYVLAIPLIPVWVWTAIDSFPKMLLTLYPLGIPAVISLQIAQSWPDIVSDDASGVRTLAVALGARGAALMSWGMVALSLMLASVSASIITDRPEWVWGSSFVSGVIVAANIVLWRSDHENGVQWAFPMIAAAVVVLGVGWTFAAIGGG